MIAAVPYVEAADLDLEGRMSRDKIDALQDQAVRIEPREGGCAGDARTADQELAGLTKIHVGSSCHIDVMEPGSLARSNGKVRRIYDLRNHEAAAAISVPGDRGQTPRSPRL